MASKTGEQGLYKEEEVLEFWNNYIHENIELKGVGKASTDTTEKCY